MGKEAIMDRSLLTIVREMRDARDQAIRIAGPHPFGSCNPAVAHQYTTWFDLSREIYLDVARDMDASAANRLVARAQRIARQYAR